jgi:hypothetical protein
VYFIGEEDAMRGLIVIISLLMLISAPVVFADNELSAKEGFVEIHKGMKKITKAVDKNAKKGAKTIDRNAKKTWKKAGSDIKKATNN